MKAKTCLALAIAAGCASVASANPEKMVLTNQKPMAADQIGHIYYNVATGEYIQTSPTQNRGLDDSAPIWINELYDQCAFGEWFYSSIRDSATGEDTYWADWGDIEPNSVVDAMTFLYFTTVPDVAEDGEEGFEMDVSFFDGVDVGSFTCELAPYLVYTITDIPGWNNTGTTTGAAWLLTIDVSGGGEFEVGDADGIDDSGNGFNSGYGADGDDIDLDGDDLADFAYGFNFRHPEGLTAGLTGCGLVVPPEGVEPNSLGDIDGMALSFVQDWAQVDGIYWFLGYSCAGGPGFLWVPWGSYYIGLYGGGETCAADRNNDGVLDFFDVSDFLGDFSAQDPSADMNNDGEFDFFDVQIYLGLFSAGCP